MNGLQDQLQIALENYEYAIDWKAKRMMEDKEGGKPIDRIEMAKLRRDVRVTKEIVQRIKAQIKEA